MPKKIAIDAGHGGFGVTPGKRSPAGEHEWNFNNIVVVAAIKRMKEYGFQVLRLDDPTGRTDVPLSTRTNKANAWGADILISTHHNADPGVWGNHSGTETYTYVGSWPAAERLAGIVQRHLVKVYGLRDRGLKKKNLHMLRESKMTAILTEGGFMDSVIDIKKMRDPNVLSAAGRAIGDAVAEYFGIPIKKEDYQVAENNQASSFPAAQKWVMEQKISDGQRPKDTVTREEVWEMMFRDHAKK